MPIPGTETPAPYDVAFNIVASSVCGPLNERARSLPNLTSELVYASGFLSKILDFPIDIVRFRHVTGCNPEVKFASLMDLVAHGFQKPMSKAFLRPNLTLYTNTEILI